MTTAVISKTVVKAGMAIIGGDRKFGLHILLVALLAIAAGAAGALLN